MEPILQAFKSLELKLFSSDDVHVLFSPETLQLFHLNSTSARVLRDIWADNDLIAVASRYGMPEEKLRAFLGGVVYSVETSRPVVRERGNL